MLYYLNFINIVAVNTTKKYYFRFVLLSFFSVFLPFIETNLNIVFHCLKNSTMLHFGDFYNQYSLNVLLQLCDLYRNVH